MNFGMNWRPISYPDRKVHGANIGPTWVLSVPDGLHVGPMDLAIKVMITVRESYLPKVINWIQKQH